MILDISKFEKAEVLAALWNHAGAKNTDYGYLLKFLTPLEKVMTIKEAERLITGVRKIEGERNLYFDYVNGRPLKVDINGDTLNTWLYDRDNGEGRAWEALEELAIKKGVTLKIIDEATR